MDKARKRTSRLSLILSKPRGKKALPFSQSPFESDPGLVVSDPDDVPEKLEPGELRVKAPKNVPWADLLLELAMTTAFSSLTEGTPLTSVEDALSYVCYFMFVWWIWVAQVAYNVRFRQPDALHKIWVFAQLIVFSALAAFTRDFDITNGIAANPDAALADALFTQAGTEDQDGLVASHFRSDRLPLLNARGLSMTMAYSRVLLLLQYSVVFYHARHLTRSSLVVHMAPLLFSAACYFATFLMLGDKGPDTGTDIAPSRAVEIVKLVLWYLPIAVEIISHFAALSVSGFVRYSREAIEERAGSVFLIILGAGLDRITSGFQEIVGNAGMGSTGIPCFISAAVIFIGIYALYSEESASEAAEHDGKIGDRRLLAWSFSQFFVLAALIVALQGIATSLSFSNISAALEAGSKAIRPVYEWMDSHPGVNVTATDFNSSANLFSGLGIPFGDFVNVMNRFTTRGIQLNDSTIVPTGQLFEEMYLYSNILDIFDAQPEENSLLYAKLDVFLHAEIGNTTELNLAKFEDLYSDIIKDRASAGLWFYAASGSVILAMALTSLIIRLPRDKWEWGVIISRLIIGSGVCLLTLLDIGASKPIFDSEGNFTHSKIWSVIGSKHMLLVIMAIAMAVLHITEILIAYAADRPYDPFDDIRSLNGPERPSPRTMAEFDHKGMDAEAAPLTSYHDSSPDDLESTNPYDPYHGQKNLETTLYSETADNIKR